MRTEELRPIVEAVDREMSRFAASDPGATDDARALLASWGKLIEFLALGPPPELRTCPYCWSVGMRAATLCGVCWRKLVPPAPLPSA